ncbi:MAG TPA: gamma-glutamylcyclotransferase family protein [Holophagaceae bacterium]|nr:gamma-glutamylcyclotransferase family protein [Holophagaceae bacterium]
MDSADGLFVYGPLREGGTAHAWLQRTHPEGICRAWAAGRLFHLPDEGFPALVADPEPPAAPPGAGWAVGDFVGYTDEAELEAALEDLDQLEGVAEDRFTRRILPVVLEGGQRYRAWVYLFPADRLPTLERRAVELMDGDWQAYLD